MDGGEISFLTCVQCGRPVRLEIAKTDERGQAVHEECYELVYTVNNQTGRKRTAKQYGDSKTPSWRDTSLRRAQKSPIVWWS